MTDLLILAGLFSSAFLAATLVPGSSEALLAGLVVSGKTNLWLLLAVATVGNVLGSLVNWLCGRFLARFRDRRWFPVSTRRYDQASAWYARFGLWSLLFAWVPIAGDPLTVIAGALRVPLVPFLVLVTIGKLARYSLVLAVALAWLGNSGAH
ncbi:YqaA family protein [Breoghania sp. L-A4]|uniref:YqaA family protein n=1 Tax=Breoghania sp. L-A4 TaxID=2304600 RepID=UPI000E35D244|nr:YqaA family protein [Breoghania sp. L-A4]AXS39456.1 DedA family protein [Breoghania sp. L-A4]